MVKAVILVKAPRSLVASKLKEIKAVKEAFSISGRFDAVALVQVKSLSELKTLTTKIQKIPNVQRTETLVQVE
ncbi:MAG: DNA-binding Lrp family transcriptional regulator [Candidatus Nitrosomirales archaeon]|jgi:DNA-binding Lrp family transcriptional regulator|nr:Lrp/AsnC ligand binding domain-containing protein [Nitrososphaerales archaeon]